MSLTRRFLRSARTLTASGRFVWLLLLVGACQLAGPAGTEPAPETGPRDPVISTERASAGQEARAGDLFARAQEAFSAGRLEEVRDLTGRIVADFPGSAVSGRALFLGAQAARDAGDATAADQAAERYIGLLDADDERVSIARLLQAEAFVDDAPARVDRLMRLPATPPEAQLVRALRLAREAVTALSADEVTEILQRAPADAVLRPVVEARAGVIALESGDAEAASAFAQSVLAATTTGPEADVAQGLLRGELPGGRPVVTRLEIATVLPTGGPPALADYANLVAEGIEVAAATALGPRYDVTVTALDDQADPFLAASLVRDLEGDRVAGAVGFLEDATLEAAGQARSRGLPLISPTARTAARAGEAVYSLEGPDPQAASTMARYAADRFLRVAIVHSQAEQSVEEADAFEATMQSLGIPVVGRFAYAQGATNFEDEIIGARNALRLEEIRALELGEDDTLHVELLDPVAVFVPIPIEDVEFVAPQISHYALDTLAIEIMGTSAWTDPQVLADLNPRHTTGVVATAPEGRGTGSFGADRFRQAYEEHFQRSLVSPVPAVGYDAALLLLEALRDDPSSRLQTRTSIERLRDIEGATGVFSVVDGIVVRRTEVVYIDNGTLVPIG